MFASHAASSSSTPLYPPGTTAPAASDSTTGPPPGLEPPPGFESLAAQIASVTVRWHACCATGHTNTWHACWLLQVGDGTVDDPDVAIKGGGLRDPETEITAKSDTLYSSAHSFEELGLSPQLLQGLYTEMKFEKPSKIQAKTLPMILTPPFKSMIAQVREHGSACMLHVYACTTRWWCRGGSSTWWCTQAHNGSGKTTCFVVSMLSRVDPALKQPQALCVCPTRELAAQNLAVVERIGKYTGISVTSTVDDPSAPTRCVLGGVQPRAGALLLPPLSSSHRYTLGAATYILGVAANGVPRTTTVNLWVGTGRRCTSCVCIPSQAHACG